MNSSLKALKCLSGTTTVDNNNQVIKSNNINGTWKLSGHFLDHDGYDVENKKIKFNDFTYNFIIDQDNEKSEFFMVQNTNGSSYQPGIIINTNPLTIKITDHDDDGIFELVETKRDNNNDLVIAFTGYYIESGFSKDNIYQRPSVGSFTMEKQSSENNIKILPSILPQNKVKKLTLADNQLWYSVYNMHETIQENEINYVITFVGPLLNSNNNIIGYITAENTYSIGQGITYCDANAVYNIYETIHDDDYKKYGQNNKYVPPNDIKLNGSLGININYQGTLSRSKFMTGTISSFLTKREGKNLPQTLASVSMTLRGRTDGARIVTCGDFKYITPGAYTAI
jgi:hypothetical protein